MKIFCFQNISFLLLTYSLKYLTEIRSISRILLSVVCFDRTRSIHIFALIIIRPSISISTIEIIASKVHISVVCTHGHGALSSTHVAIDVGRAKKTVIAHASISAHATIHSVAVKWHWHVVRSSLEHLLGKHGKVIHVHVVHKGHAIVGHQRVVGHKVVRGIEHAGAVVKVGTVSPVRLHVRIVFGKI
ncbi:hypothetical protein BpHYR1_000827 [Brachionus plicatilis]|uniref:Uncharacterized protein n=1 Tax=Brachionus plicatilis TaxID=10195 RepID=A0A3M7QJK2_BRAPC|nr:hypothetical protein BpHYR1_000827 [Brachionus plicatilis]